MVKIDGKWRSTTHARSAHAWRARIYYRGFDGLLDDVSVRRRTRREAEDAARSALATRLSVGDNEIKSTTPLVAVAEQWLEHIKRPGFDGLSPRSIELYEQTYRRHIDAKGSSIRGLTISHANSVPRLRSFLQGISDNNGEGVANTTKTVLSHVIRWALENGDEAVTHNAARSFKTPKSASPKETKRDRTRALTAAEQDKVLGHADKLARQENPRPASTAKGSDCRRSRGVHGWHRSQNLRGANRSMGTRRPRRRLRPATRDQVSV